jgi:hypothetical protein
MMKLLLLFITFFAVFGVKAQTNFATITNDVFWKTTKGTPIYSQGGGIFRFPDSVTGVAHYYWYGVHYAGAETYLASPTGKNSNTGFVSVTCYQSDDLVNWTFVSDVLTSTSLTGAYWLGRLGVAYVAEAKKYALVMQYNSSVLIAVCETPTGNFTRHNNIDMTSMIGTSNTGDQTVFTDDNGKSYLVYSYGSGRSRIYLSEIGVKDGKVTLLDCNQVYKGDGREGNCMFKYKGKYYICASDLYGWNASNVYYLESTSIYGPYTPTNSMLKMPGAESDYGHVTQTGFFYTVKGSKEETVIYCGDRWADFAGNGNGYNQWCPLSFVNNAPYFNSLSQWSLNAEIGEWEVGKDNNYAKNGSFDADRVNIPSGNKPVQTYLTGWSFVVSKGNTIAVGSAQSPVLNASNSSTDRAVVSGNKCLNITDSIAFTRKIFQNIASSAYVPIIDGKYTLTAKVKSGSQFNVLYMYALSNNDTFKTDLPYSGSQWHRVVIKDVIVKDGKVEIGFMADGAAKAWCRIDDVTLIKNGEQVQTIRILSVATKTFGDAPFAISSTVTPSGYPVEYSVMSGPATISGNTVTLAGAGQVTIMAYQSGDSLYNAASETVTFTVNKANTKIEWSNPTSISYGTALSDIQLNAKVEGSTGLVSYNPAEGTVLPEDVQTLTVSCAADSNYEAAAKSVTIEVTPAPAITSNQGLVASDITIYPNPVKHGTVEVLLPNGSDNALLEIKTLTGEIVLTKNIQRGNALVNIDNLPGGYYLFSIRTNRVMVVRLVCKM